MKLGAMPYPCVGYCIIDSRGYCVACGRPPDLGAPDLYPEAAAERNAAVVEQEAGAVGAGQD